MNSKETENGQEEAQGLEVSMNDKLSSKQLWKGFTLGRVVLVCLLLLGAAGFVHSFNIAIETPIDKSLKHFPYTIGRWEAGNDRELTESVSDMLGVDDYAFRDYRSPEGMSINFYASYFAAVGMTGGFHSPLHCMPGSGWSIASTEDIKLELPGRDGAVVVRKLLMKQGSQFQVSLYWYQCRSKIFASEYWELFYRVLDSFRYRRTDGAFVRLIAYGVEDEAMALKMMKSFAGKVIPLLEEHLPGV